MKKNMIRNTVAALLGAGLLASVFTSCEAPGYPETEVTPGTSGNTELTSYDALTISPVNAALGADYMRGIDASEVRALEECEVKFYDENNQEKDVFKILADHGVNWIRLRIWNDYTKALEDDWGPYGYNNLSRTVNMAQRAVNNGMKVFLDFHYSDTWADPASQKCPAVWAEIDNIDDLKAAVADWTVEVLQEMKTAGCEPAMIQIGNEMEGGIFQCGSAVTSSVANSAEILSAVSEKVRAYNPDIQIMLHMSRGGNAGVLTNFYNNFVSKVDCDAVGLSYYPYYTSHGTIANLQANVDKIVNTYNKKAVIAEISYGYSKEAWSDTTDNTFYEDQEAVAASMLTGYAGITKENGKSVIKGSLENQAGVVREVIEKTAAKGASGLFYWGACYLGVDDLMPSAWENQALFDVNGKVLPTLDVMAVKGN